jgi:hypothetical protein
VEGRVGEPVNGRTAAQGVSAATGSMQHQRRPAERRVAKPCTRVLVHVVVPRRGPSRLLTLLPLTPQRLLVCFRSPKSFCTSSARAEPKAAALRRIAAKPAPSALVPACCCCCCFGCCFGGCFAVLPPLCTFDFRAFDGVSTSRFAQAALRTANCWNAGDPAMHAHRPNQRRVVRVDRQSEGAWRYGSVVLGFRESACTSQSLDNVLLCQVGDQAPDEA